MPDQISVSEFVAETHEDYKAPTASSFTTRTAQCRDTVAAIEEVNYQPFGFRPQLNLSMLSPIPHLKGEFSPRAGRGECPLGGQAQMLM
ncbi:uncharacterized protein LOC668525 isoform X2 [Mus musculus]|uniref:uncharacterized protein LOC668525 isoform X2 n=1 Tax=Mus musculus TaxID=10090 RepID=UPI0016748112|nr:uncharacterized protein LOC668525 isoform X2 [Mus musculus]